jgi:membrane fusion protein
MTDMPTPSTQVPVVTQGNKSDNGDTTIVLPNFRQEVIEASRLSGWALEPFFDPSARRLLARWCLAISFGIIALLCLIPYSEEVAGRGELVPEGGAARVLAPTRGSILRFTVAEGDRVSVGDTIALIQTETRSLAGLDPVEPRRAELRLRAELIQQRMAIQNTTAALQQQKLEAEAQALSSRLMANMETLRRQEDVVRIGRERRERIKDLADKGLITRLQLDSAETDLIRAQNELAGRRDDRKLLELRALQVQEELLEVRKRREDEIAQLADQLSLLRQSQVDADVSQGFAVTAPIAGVVASLAVQPGTSVAPDRPIALIVPEGKRLEAELYVPSTALGMLAAGTPVLLHLDAFPSHLYGPLRGEVTDVGTILVPPSYLPETADRTLPAYRVRIRLATQSIAIRGRKIELRPGMTLGGDMVLNVRPLALRLIDPLAQLGIGVIERYGLTAKIAPNPPALPN